MSNYHSDSRVIAGNRSNWYNSFCKRTMTATVDMYDENDNTTEVTVPVKFEVCPTCEGKGSHVNPSIDADGICASEWDDMGEDSQEAYMSGMYDVACYECKGERLVIELDRDKADPEVVESLDSQRRDQAAFEWESAQERTRAHDGRVTPTLTKERIMPTQEDIDLYNEFWIMVSDLEAQGIDPVAYIRAYKVKD